MPPRLAHTKSRTGCLRCKTRKVKCDEHQPACFNCRRHNVECQYPTNGHSPTKTPAVNHEPGLEKSLSPDQRRHLELQLLHYFSSSVVWTLGSAFNAVGREIWTYTAVELGFKYPFLQSAIFAFTALYLIKTTPESRHFFASPEEQQTASRAINRELPLLCHLPLSTIHELYLDLGLRQQREAVDNITAASSDALFLSTVLYWYQAAPQFSLEVGRSNYTPPVHWLRMARANRDIARLSMSLMPNKNIIRRIQGDDGPDWEDLDALYGIQNCKPFETLLDWDAYPEPEPCSEETKTIYSVFLAYVGSIHKALQEQEPARRLFRRFLCLGVMLPSEVVGFVEERRPRALAILAHYFAMSYSLNDHWIWHGLAEYQTSGLESIMPSQWMWAMDWPKQTLNELQKGKVYRNDFVY